MSRKMAFGFIILFDLWLIGYAGYVSYQAFGAGAWPVLIITGLMIICVLCKLFIYDIPYINRREDGKD